MNNCDVMVMIKEGEIKKGEDSVSIVCYVNDELVTIHLDFTAWSTLIAHPNKYVKGKVSTTPVTRAYA